METESTGADPEGGGGGGGGGGVGCLMTIFTNEGGYGRSMPNHHLVCFHIWFNFNLCLC